MALSFLALDGRYALRPALLVPLWHLPYDHCFQDYALL